VGYGESYLGRSESKDTRSVFHKSKTFTLCGHCFAAALCMCEQRSICKLYAWHRKILFLIKVAEKKIHVYYTLIVNEVGVVAMDWLCVSGLEIQNRCIIFVCKYLGK
jgi:hypothetical protein